MKVTVYTNKGQFKIDRTPLLKLMDEQREQNRETGSLHLDMIKETIATVDRTTADEKNIDSLLARATFYEGNKSNKLKDIGAMIDFIAANGALQERHPALTICAELVDNFVGDPSFFNALDEYMEVDSIDPETLYAIPVVIRYAKLRVNQFEGQLPNEEDWVDWITAYEEYFDSMQVTQEPVKSIR